MNFLLEVGKSEYGDKIIETLGPTETLIFGGQMVLIGMLTVFSVLIIIWIALSLVKVFFAKSSEGTKTEKAAFPTEATAPATSSASDEEIIAVIAAAIAMAEAEGNGAKFRVVSFRRK